MDKIKEKTAQNNDAEEEYVKSKNNSNSAKLNYSYKSYSNQFYDTGYNPNAFCAVHQQLISQQFKNLFKWGLHSDT